MFRRRREDASPRPPASSAWWTPPDGQGAEPPPLPTSDPFGGWPAFPAEPGRRHPVDDWGMPLPPGGQFPSSAHNGGPGWAPGQPDNLAFPGQPSAGDPAGTERMPLLTHDEQSIQDEFARFGPVGTPSDDMLEAESWGAPPAPDRDTPGPRGDRGRISRPRRSAETAAPIMPVEYPIPAPPAQSARPSALTAPPTVAQPPSAQPATAQPSAGQPPLAQPSVGQPSIGQPPVGQPSIAQPDSGQPPLAQPSIGQPSIGQPDSGQPAVQPPVGQPPVGQPPVGLPDSGQQPLAQPSIGQPSIGQPPVGQPSIGQPDSGQRPLAQPPVGQLDSGQRDAVTAQAVGIPAQQPIGLGLTIMAEAMEAAALAGAFAADYLSWDESNPTRRGVVLMQYLPSDVVGDASLLGWSGRGRQRSEFALPGAVRPDGEGRLIVDVRVRITPYRAVGQSAEPASDPEDQMEVAGVPAVAPAPTARGWKSLDSYWVRLAVPVIRDQGRLVVDTWDEQLGDAPEDDLDEDSAPSTAKPVAPPPPVDITPGDALPTDTATAEEAPTPRTKKATTRTRASRTTAKSKVAATPGDAR